MKYNLEIKKEKLNSYIEDRESKISNIENHIKYINYINTQFTNPPPLWESPSPNIY